MNRADKITKIIILFFIIILFIVVSFSLYLFFPEKIKRNENSKITQPITMNIPVLQYKYNPGDSFFYNIQYDAKTFFEEKGQTNSYFDVNIKGLLRKNIYNVQNNKAYIGYCVISPIINMTNLATDYSKEVVEKALQTEIYVIKTENGVIEQWFFPQSIPESLRNTMKSLLCNLQVIFKDEACSDWENQEEDVNGTYNVRYKLAQIANSKNMMIFKRKSNYIEEQQKKLNIIKSKSDIIFNVNENYIESIKVYEELSTTSMNIHTQGVYNIFYSFDRKEFDPLLSKSMSNEKNGMYSTSSSKLEGEKHYKENAFKRTLGNKTWIDLEKEWQAIHQKGGKNSNFDLFETMIAWISLNPDQIYRVSKLVLSSEKMDGSTSLLCGALAHAEVPEAQDALIEIIEKRQDDTDFSAMTISYLGQVKEPTDATIQELQNLTNIENTVTPIANLALGSVIGKLKDTDPSRANALIYDFETKLQNTTEFEKQTNYLATLGNAGNISSIAVIEPFLKNSNIDLRAKGYDALRFIKDENAERLLTKGLLEESNAYVKTIILEAMQYRNNGEITYNALVEMIGRETNNQHKITEAGLLWKMRKTFPQAETIVRQYSTSDTSIKVRNAIRSIILTDPR